MCGIIACIGKEASPFIINGLKQLQNRGYDSAGISLLYQRQWTLQKYASQDSVQQLSNIDYPPSLNGIGHTRWATHGAKTIENAHPHRSQNGEFMLVHNGIIENYKILKEFLTNKGFVFYSQTDSEVIVNLLEYYSHKYNVLESIQWVTRKMEGTWGLCIQCLKEEHTIYCVRHGSPLLVSHNGEFALVSSEYSGFCGIMNHYIELQSNDVCKIDYDQDTIHINTHHTYELKTVPDELFSYTHEPYLHWTQKEIFEQPQTIHHVTNHGSRYHLDGTIFLGGLNKELLSDIQHIILLGCGTSYFSACIGCKYIKTWCNFVSVQCLDAGEFSVSDIPKGKCAFLLVSQSGETKDLHKCIDLLQDHIKIGVINKVDSAIAREVDFGCYLNAGREVGVASTKSFVSQVVLLSMIALWFSQLQRGLQSIHRKVIQDLGQLSEQIAQALKVDVIPYLPMFKDHCFILGKEYDEYSAKEASLKMKELAYLHAEGYSSSSLKHGPFALLDEEFPVILLAPRDKHWQKNENVYEELKSRTRHILTITNEPLDRENTIMLPKNKTYQCILNIIPLQLLSYELAVLRGYNPDTPRNLAKVVTVE